ncbi:alkaline phosphatase PhoX [Yinghuangia soli]|uniref:PhoX family protein n=1 Tax=Yinghuangia soli TaxID=2908204 RepID=A0AA41U3Q0_9ACTN|nr:alkaline phosphatase PhoX [Yinghuangia soli]MCF2532051.1 PhoX family protein [Yinghuangia soli]
MDRRTFLRGSVVGTGAVALGGSLWASAAHGAPAQPGAGPYGPLLPPDGLGVRLPAGFSSRIVARSGRFVSGTLYLWHGAPDGGACYPDGDGWIYVSNSELPLVGGASALRFAADGRIRGARSILGGTNLNCAGGATPWGTWLSCEEIQFGQVWESDPYGRNGARARPAMGRFKHEAAAADPDRRVVYLTEDEGDGCLYRFTPATWGDLSAGRLDVLCAPAEPVTGPVTWQPVPRPEDWATGTRNQVPAARRFRGGEGAHYRDGKLWFTTKGDNRVWVYDAAAQVLDIAYDDDLTPPGSAPLTGVDNITGRPNGDLFVAEDGGDMQICLITGDGTVAPFLQVTGHDGSEITGPAFSPDGRRLYFSSQRGSSNSVASGVTFEVTGPFRGAA